MSEHAPRLALRDAFSNVQLRHLLLAYAGAAISEWAVWLAVLVYAQEQSGSGAAGWMALALLVPLVVAAPFAGRAFSGADPVGVLRTVFVGQGLTLAVAAVLAAIDAPLIVLSIPAAVAIGGIAFVRPGQAVLTPGLVQTARELTTANLFVGYIDSACVLVGPILATACLAAGGAEATLGVCGLFAFGGALAAHGFRDRRQAGSRSGATTVESDASTDHGRSTATPQRPSLWRVVKVLRGRDHVMVLLVVLGLQHLLMGVMGLMFVVLAVEELGMGSSGAGVLNIAFGVGAVASGLGATLLAGRGRLAPVVAASVAAMAVATLALGLVDAVPAALVALAVAGFGRSLLDVTARMLLQRSVPPQYLSSVFAIIEVLTSVGLAIGTVYSQVMVSTAGATTGLVAFAIFLAVVLALTVGRVWEADRSADVPVVAVTLLKSMSAFAPLPPVALEAVARSSVERTFEPGSVLMREGDPGECYHAIAGGEVEVTIRDRPIRRLGRGDGAGDVALLSDGPRTATVTAVTRTHTLEIGREVFLLAVTGNESSLRAVHRQIEDFEF